MAAPSPSLSLSDIMHPFSPPPTAMQHRASSPPQRARSITPEPLELAEIEDMRRKILSMGWGDSSTSKDKIETKEQELVDMLLRLTHPASLPQPSQLHAQAETIAHLIQQRDFLAQRSAEERERWESEREGWARAAQALISRGRRESVQADKDDAMTAQYALVTADASTQRMQEFERANISLQNDKKSLQQKLADTQRRLALLESELAQLKPLLLMQPFALTHSHPTGTARGWSAVLPSTSSAAASRREKDRELQRERNRRPQDIDPDVEEEDLDTDGDVNSQPLQVQPQFRGLDLRSAMHEGQPPPPGSPGSPSKPKGDYYRHRELQTPSSYYPSSYYPSAQLAKPGRRKVGAVGQTVVAKPKLSDARAEHLLLAARKIGRQRASILSGAFAHVPQSESTFHYKQKGAPTSQSKQQQQPPRTPRRNANANANTPLLTRTPLGQPGSAFTHPRTPLQSLLSAAKSVLSATDGTSPTNESPLAKRRKLDPSAATIRGADTPPAIRKEKEKDKEKEKSKQRLPLPGVARVKSALDFLADQAEVYSTQPPSQGSADSGGSPPKDTEEAPSQDAEMEDVDSIYKSIPEKGKAKALTSGSGSRPRTPVTDEVDRPRRPRSNSHRDSTATTSNKSTLQRLHQPDDDSNPEGSLSTPNAHLTLAPPIDLTPRTSLSPAPQRTRADVRSPRKRSRSSSTERRRSPTQNALPLVPGSFSISSLQDPQVVVTALSGIEQTIEPGHDQAEGAASKIVENVKFCVDAPPRRTRSPYIKWTKEEDELLAKAVAKHGQKWDLVQKALPSRGYHQVRQRWLRKLGVFDGNKLDLASLETNAAAEFLNLSTAPPTDSDGRSTSELRSTPNMKLGLAPLNSEKVLTGSSSSSTGRSLSPFPANGPGGSGSGFPFPPDSLAEGS